MRHVRRPSAFTLVEVLLAMLVLTTSIYLLSSLQIRSVFRVLESRDFVQRVFIVKRQLYDMFLAAPSKRETKEGEQEKPIIKEYDDPAVKISTQMKTISKKSALRSFAPYVRIIESDGTWKRMVTEHRLPMISFVAAPKKKKDEKA